MPFLKLLSLSALALILVIPEADARRLSGGRSFGKQREAVTQPAPTQAPSAAPAPVAPNATPASAGSRWLGPVAGLLAGFGLGALFMNGGLGAVLGGLATVVLLGLALVFAAKLAMRYGGGAPAPAGRPQPVRFGSDATPTPPPASPVAGKSWFQPGTAAAPGAQPFPPDFDAAAFTRHAKLNFTRLQQAYDEADVSALREVMSDEMYREIEADLAKSAPGAARTEVVNLDAQVLAVVIEGNHYVASVRFSGQLREGAGAAEPFTETWHLEKPRLGGGGWLLAGIQQD
jgi:predicted lipid-binding transport protein (Tim44 family)